MEEHVLDDRIRSLAMLSDLVEIAFEHCSKLADLGEPAFVDVAMVHELAKLIHDLDRKSGKVVDEIERVFDLMRDSGGELPKRGELLGLNQSVLSGAQLLQ